MTGILSSFPGYRGKKRQIKHLKPTVKLQGFILDSAFSSIYVTFDLGAIQ